MAAGGVLAAVSISGMSSAQRCPVAITHERPRGVVVTAVQVPVVGEAKICKSCPLPCRPAETGTSP
ncbi:hypothetical protein [Benzoatithermus flavus]|uniref:Secreted protein n=1 Tax=Benzoatithermus flavus TaxID=3108223 RepID=A0ABU8XWU6_9PROT